VGSNIGTPALAKSGMNNFYDFGLGLSFQLSDLQNVAKYTALYDLYKLNYVTLKVTYMSNTSSVGGGTVLPTMYTVIDLDDNSVPTLVQQIKGRQGYKSINVGDKMKNTMYFKIYPKVSVVNYSINPTTNNAGYMVAQGWQDCAYPSNAYYGMKMFFTDILLAASSSETAFKFDFKYNVSFKGALNEY